MLGYTVGRAVIVKLELAAGRAAVVCLGSSIVQALDSNSGLSIELSLLAN